MSKDSAKTESPRKPTDRREEYDFYLSVLSEVLPKDEDEDSTVSDGSGSSSSSDESSVDEYAIPRQLGGRGGGNRATSLSLRNRHDSVPLEVVFGGPGERPVHDDEEQHSVSSEDLCSRREVFVREIPEQTMEALGQLSVSESIGSLPRSRAMHWGNNDGAPSSSFNNNATGRMMMTSGASLNNNISGRGLTMSSSATPHRRARSGSMESVPLERRLVREGRSFPSILHMAPGTTTSSTAGSQYSGSRDQAPRRPRQCLRILDNSDSEEDDILPETTRIAACQ